MTDTIEVRDLRQQDWVWVAKALLFHPDVDEKMYKVYNGLAAYADNVTQQAFPSIDTLNKKLHMSRSTVIRALQKLEDFSFISVERVQGGHNTYSLLSIPDTTKRKPKVDASPPQEEVPFDCDAYYELMLKDKRRPVQIIGFFLKTKQLKFQSKDQVHAAIKEHIRAATDLTPFEKPLIGNTIRKLAHDWPKFTLKTVLKEVTK